MEALVSKAWMIQLSLQPSPASETSAFNRMRAFNSRFAGLFPLRISACKCSRSPALNRTTYTGEEITAVLWSSDLHGFTERSDRYSGEQVIMLLNALFDAQAKAIADHGG